MRKKRKTIINLNLEFLRQHAMTAASLILKSGERLLYYSIDKKKDRLKGNHKPGMQGLIDRIISEKHCGEYKVASIWDRNNQLLARWDEKGKRIDVTTVKPQQNDEFKEKALSKLSLILLNGEKRLYYSIDTVQDRNTTNIEPGIQKLIQKFIEGKHQGEFRVATIWDRDNKLIAKWDHLGHRVPNDQLNQPINALDIEDLKHRALTKLTLILNSNEKKCYYSLDNPKDLLNKDYGPGMTGLRTRIVEGKHKGEFKVATIWENRPNGPVLAQWNEHGRRII